MKFHSVTIPIWYKEGVSFHDSIAPFAARMRAKARRAALAAEQKEQSSPAGKQVRKRQNKLPVIIPQGTTRPISTLRKYKK
jgi:hypothetical protein